MANNDKTKPTALPDDINYKRIDAGDERLSKYEMGLLKAHLSDPEVQGNSTEYQYQLHDSQLLVVSGYASARKKIEKPEDLVQRNSLKNPWGIKVVIIQHDGKTLVKIGPCDLSGVGGHKNREALIKNLVNDVLKTDGRTETYDTVNVSACVGVRGRAQMITGAFKSAESIRSEQGKHMNAYIKTAGENALTHWEPRKGPQGFFNDTICAMVVAIATRLFEHKVMSPTKEPTYSSEQATKEILQNRSFKEIFNKVLTVTKDKVGELVKGYKNMLNQMRSAPDDPAREEDASNTHQPKL